MPANTSGDWFGHVPGAYRHLTHTQHPRPAIVRFTPSKPRATTSARTCLSFGQFSRFFTDTDCYLYASTSCPQMHWYTRDWASMGKLDWKTGRIHKTPVFIGQNALPESEIKGGVGVGPAGLEPATKGL